MTTCIRSATADTSCSLTNRKRWEMPGRVRAITAALVLSGAVVSAHAQETPQQTQRRVGDALARRDGLHEAAKIKGGSIVIVDGAHGIVAYPDLQSISQESDAVLVGRTLENVCKLAGNGGTIVTEYQVKAEEVMQGTA